ncbi:MAG: SGNH/GDSL hydrolase family protein [Burkholderiales bacterium]|nr:SGNH/GDSL hydrolase family protein [Burkholderiales bacterium]
MRRPYLLISLGLTGLALSVVLCLVLSWLWHTAIAGSTPVPSHSPHPLIRLAILGDSDSHAYHDTLSFPLGSPSRGSQHRPQTWQWSEILAQLRGDQVDLGPWGIWGAPQSVALLQDAMGLGGRSPRKMDHQYNFAQSGAGCDALIRYRMARRLVQLMDQAPQAWVNGIVLIRIGINDLGTREALQALSLDPMDRQVQASITACIAQHAQTIQLIHAHHPHTRIVLVGLFNNMDWPPYVALWQTAQARSRIQQGLAVFNTALQQLAAQDTRLAYLDDQAWFADHWGSRDAAGHPAYHPLRIGNMPPITHSQGNELTHATLADGHNGTAWNLLWTQALIHLLNQRFDTHIQPITDEDAAGFMARQYAQPPDLAHMPHPLAQP